MRRERWCDPRMCGDGGGSGEVVDEESEAAVEEVVEVVEVGDNHERFVSSLLRHRSDR